MLLNTIASQPMPPLFFNIELVFLFLNPRELVFFNPMMHKHGDFGQIPVSDTSISKTPLKSVPNKCPFFFFWKKSGYITNMVVTRRISQTRKNLKNKNKRKRERKNRIWPNTSLFPSILWSNMCGVSSWSKSATIEPPPTSNDPKAPSLSLCHFSLYRFWVLCLLGFQLFLSLFFFLFFSFFFFWVLCLSPSPYACTVLGQWV